MGRATGKGWDHSHDAAESPNVRLAAVALLVQNLGREIVRRTADRFAPAPHGLQSGRQPEIPDLQLHGLADEKVTCK